MKRKIAYAIIMAAVIISAFFIGKSRGKSEMVVLHILSHNHPFSCQD